MQPIPRKKESEFGKQHACGSIGMYAMSCNLSRSEERTAPPAQQPSSVPATAEAEVPEPSKDDPDAAQSPQEHSPAKETEGLGLVDYPDHAYMSDNENVPDPGDHSEDENAEKPQTVPINGHSQASEGNMPANGGTQKIGQRLSFAWNANARRSSGELAASNALLGQKRSRFEDETAQATRQAAEADPLSQCWYYLDPLVSI